MVVGPELGYIAGNGSRVMPYPSEHAFRVKSPSAFQADSFRRKEIADGVSIIVGKPKGGDKMETQTYRFAKDQFTFAEAKKWMEEHDVKHISAEKAVGNVEEGKGHIQLAANMSKLVREEKFEGRDYLVAPAVLIAEGVHNGVYYPADELAKFPEAWNGRPLPVYHPAVRGKPVSANQPGLLESQSIGQLFNAKYENGKLKAEAWIDKAKAGAIAANVLELLEKDQQIEVSTGLFVDEDATEGNWNGERYTSIARNHRPDHFAILPGIKGACSWEDGAGMPRVNAAKDEEEGEDITEEVLAELEKELDAKGEKPAVNYSDDQARAEDGKWTDGGSGRVQPQHYASGRGPALSELKNEMRKYKVKVVREKDQYGDSRKEYLVTGPDGTKDYESSKERAMRTVKWRASYKLEKGMRKAARAGVKSNQQEEIDVPKMNSFLTALAKAFGLAAELEEEEVGSDAKPREDGAALSSESPTALQEQKRKDVQPMDKERKEKVDALLANAESGWLEEHRTVLEGMPEGAFKKVLEAAARPKTNAQEPPKPAETVEALLANASPAVKAEVESALAVKKEAKAKAVAAIKANERNKFTDEELNGKTIAELNKLAEMLAPAQAPAAAPAPAQEPVVNMSGKSTAPTANQSAEDEVPEMPRIEFKK